MLTDRLLRVIETGEVLRVRYFGGSTPGAERQLRPISIADGKVRALCLQSGETKTFVIEKLEEAIEGVPSALARLVTASPKTFLTIEEFVAHYAGSFQASGWIVQHDGQSVSLHRSFKSGKVIKSPDVALTFEATTYDAVFDGEQIIEANPRERSRPWIVRGAKKTTKTFGEIGKAQLTFLDFASQLSPNSAP